jgi:hypothetical protein
MGGADTCVFCGATGTDFRPEHWVSQWISRAVIPAHKRVVHHVPGREIWVRNLFDLTVDHVCPNCNHHWMSDIESRAQPIALPLIQKDVAKMLSPTQQRRLATWCFLKVITAELGRPAHEKPTYPDWIYEGFGQHHHPPDVCLISIGFRDDLGDPELFVWWKSEGHEYALADGREANGYRTTIAIGHLVIDVLGVLVPAKLEVEDDRRLLRIWPVSTRSLQWPPADRFKAVVNNDLA